ncbi:MAG: hypothetical protein BMS9Abin34_129 [Patescibacteria group bacterium]|nr:MAG: hypothetical protein BMS9Abin34_129 [Patescibacteria group bacterium]
MPRCNDCEEEGVFRCSVVMPEGTPRQDAVFVKDGITYGYTYHYCSSCLAVQQTKGGKLKVWEDSK